MGWGVDKIEITAIDGESASLTLRDYGGNAIGKVSIEHFTGDDLKNLQFIDETGNSISGDRINSHNVHTVEPQERSLSNLFGVLHQEKVINDFSPEKDRIVVGKGIAIVDVEERGKDTVLHMLDDTSKEVSTVRLTGTEARDIIGMRHVILDQDSKPLSDGRIGMVRGLAVSQDERVFFDDARNNYYELSGKDAYEDSQGNDIVRGGKAINDGAGYDQYFRGEAPVEYSLATMEGSNFIDVFKTGEDKFTLIHADAAVEVLQMPGEKGIELTYAGEGNNNGRFILHQVDGTIDDIKVTRFDQEYNVQRGYMIIAHSGYGDQGPPEKTISHFDVDKHVLRLANDVDSAVNVTVENNTAHIEFIGGEGKVTSRIALENVSEEDVKYLILVTDAKGTALDPERIHIEGKGQGQASAAGMDHGVHSEVAKLASALQASGATVSESQPAESTVSSQHHHHSPRAGKVTSPQAGI